MLESLRKNRNKRVRTPTVLQMEAVECGAASLAIILGYHGKIVPLEELRNTCGVSRDGSKASNVAKAARVYGLTARGLRKEPEGLEDVPLPCVIHWNFNHFLVFEGFHKGYAYLNDPAAGPRKVLREEFDNSFTGVTIAMEPGPEFEKSGQRRSLISGLGRRLKGLEDALLFVVLAGLGLVLPGLVVPVFTKVFVDEILVGRMESWFKPLLVGMAITAVLRAALTFLRERYLLRMETRLSLTTSSRFFWHVLRLPMDFFSQRFAGDISSRVAINDRIAKLVSGKLATTVVNMAMIVFYAILMFYYDAVLTSVGILIAALNIVALRFVARVRTDQNRKLLQDRGKLAGYSMGGIQAIETLKATGSETDYFAKWSGYQAKVVTSEQKLGLLSLSVSALPPFLTALNTALILSLGSLRVMDGDITMGMLVAFQSLMASFIAPVNEFVDLLGTLQEVEGDMNRLDDVLAYEEDVQLNDKSAEGKYLAEGKLNGEVELRGLTFGYSSLEEPLISDFSLQIPPGGRVALVGGSGSGKSTVAKLVSGLYKPWSGEVCFDGRPRKAIHRDTLVSSIAMVDQDICLFGDSLRNNIAMWDDTLTEAEVIQAARDARIHDDLSARDAGYDHVVSEGGGNFSGGQRQRIEIARALAGKPSILVMDEATSALDPATEKGIDDNIRRRGCTCLIVAHRLSTIRDCDEIIVMERGKVVQRGTHEEMISDESSPYANLVKSA